MHHELGVGRHDEDSPPLLQRVLQMRRGAIEVEGRDGHAEHIQSAVGRHAKSLTAATLADRDEAPTEEVEMLERDARALRDAVQRVLRDVARNAGDLRQELVHVPQ